MVAREGVVERLEQLGGARIVGADDDPVRLHEVRDRRAFLEELGIRHDVELEFRTAPPERLLDALAHLVGRPDRHGRLVDHDAKVVHMPPDRLSHRKHVREIRRTILLRGRAHRDELEETVGDALLRAGRELEAALLEVTLHDCVQTGLVDGYLALLQSPDLGLVDIYADHVVADFGKARAGHEADVTGAKHRHFHA